MININANTTKSGNICIPFMPLIDATEMVRKEIIEKCLLVVLR